MLSELKVPITKKLELINDTGATLWIKKTDVAKHVRSIWADIHAALDLLSLIVTKRVTYRDRSVLCDPCVQLGVHANQPSNAQRPG